MIVKNRDTLVRRTGIAMVLLCALLAGGCNLFMDADAKVARASERMQSGDYQGATIELRDVLQEHPEHARARQLLAEATFKTGDAATADKELRRALETGTDPATVAELAAQIRLALGQAKELLVQIDSGELPLVGAQRQLYRGKALLAQRQLDAAIPEFRAALVAEPQSRPARLALAEALAIKGETQEAMTLVDQLLQSEQSDPAALLLKGRMLVSRGDLAGAEKALIAAEQRIDQLDTAQRVLLLSVLTEAQLATGNIAAAEGTQQRLTALGPDLPVTRILGARIAMAKQDYAAASAELQRIVTALPELTAARFLLGAALLAQGNLNQAESQLVQVVQVAPENLEARKLLAQVRLRLNQPDAARQALLPAEASGDTDTQTDTLLGLALFQLGDTNAAVQVMERSAAARPQDRGAQLDLAATYVRAGQHRKAIELIESVPYVAGDSRREAILVAAIGAEQGMSRASERMNEITAAHPRDTAVLSLASVFFAQNQQFDRARKLAADALAVNPRDIPTLLTAAKIELAAGNPAAAATRLESILQVDSDSMVARLGLAELAMRRDDLVTAARWLEEQRARDPKAVEPQLGLAKIYLRQKRTKEADELLRGLATTAAERHDIANAIGLLYLDTGRYDEAISRFQAAVAADSRNPTYWLNLARAQLAVDRPALARESLERARAARPDSIAVSGALVFMDLKEQKPDAAAARIAQLKKERPGDPGVLVLEGDMRMTLKDYTAADAAYQKAVAIRMEGSTAVKSYRARTLGRLQDPTAPLIAWLSRQPDDLATQAVLAEAYQASGLRQRAIATYELIVDNGPPNAVMLNNLAWLYYQENDSRAEATALRAYELAPHAVSIADTYGWILVENGKVAEGVKILKDAAAHASGNPDVGFHYAAALARAGDKQTARQQLLRLLEKHDSFASRQEARQLLQDLPQ